MGLLDDFPYGLLNQIRNGTQSRIPNGNFSADNADGFPSWVPRQQRLPLSFAGPDLTTNITASSPDRPADFLRAQPPAPPAPNLTVQALRMKGVPEADISAATGNPELMKQFVIQHYGPGSTGAPLKIGYATSGRSVSGGLFGDSSQRAYPEARWLNPYRVDADPVQLNDQNGFFFGPGYTEDPDPKQNPAPLAKPTPPTQLAGSGPECDGFDAGCHEGGTYGTNG
jgi:hypothetical protein